ncbi:MAG: BolA family protein [Cellvibrionaceae bacterium]
MLIQNTIEEKVKSHFAPEHFEIINESGNHNVPAGSESHFKLLIVSDVFAGLSKVKRQQSVYKLLSDELSGEVHALSMQTFSLEEWAQQPESSVSPPCMGGSQPS